MNRYAALFLFSSALVFAGCRGAISAAADGHEEAAVGEDGRDGLDGGWHEEPLATDGDGPGGDAGDDVGSDGDHGGMGEPCGPLSPPTGQVIRVRPQQAAELRSIVASVASGSAIVLEDGVYAMDGGDAQSRLSFDKPDVTLRSASGNPQAVVLDGGWITGELVSISASRVTIAEITLQRAYYHPVHVTGGASSIEGVRLYRLRIIDPAEQGIKINPSGDGTFADRGLIECCHLELSDAGRAQVRNNCYTGGIDGHQAWGWTVRLNTIRGFWCPQGLSEHAVHFWTGSRDTLVERNVIIDCARGIGFGLGESGSTRTYPDDPYPGAGYIGHYDGLIRNNFIAASSSALFASEYGFDSGIALEQARGARVFHNSVFSSQPPFSSIEWRFDNTRVEVKNNLLSHNLRDRGGQAELAANIENAPSTWFVDPASGDLHLLNGSGAENSGVELPQDACPQDFDGQLRGIPPDVGADER